MKKMLALAVLLLCFATVRAQYFYITVYDNCTHNKLTSYPIGFQYSSPALYGTYWATTQPAGSPQEGMFFPVSYDDNLYPGGTYTFCGSVVLNNGATLASPVTGCNDGTHTAYLIAYVNNPQVTSYTLNGLTLSTNPAAPTQITYCPGSTALPLVNTSNYLPNIQKYNLSISLNGTPLYSTGWQTGSLTASSDLQSYLGASPPAGNYTITLQNQFCGGSTVTLTSYFNLVTPTPVSISGLTVNSIYQTSSSPATIILCTGSPVLTMHATTAGVLQKYSVTIDQGTWLSGTFHQSATKTTGYLDGGSIPDYNLYTLFGSYMTGYNGDIRVTASAVGPCGTTASYTQYFHIQIASPVTAVNFTLKGKTQPVSTVDSIIWLCNSDSTLPMVPTVTGTVGTYTLTVTKGTFSSGTFNAGSYGSVSNGPNTAGSVPTIDLGVLFHAYLHGYNGAIQVSLAVNGPCGNLTTKTQVFDIESANAAVDFTMTGPGTCGYMNRDTVAASTLAQPVSGPAPCVAGWLGDNTAGIFGYSITATAGSDSFKIVVDDTTTHTNVVNYAGTGTLPVYSNFNYLAGLSPGGTFGWFGMNYTTIRNSHVFKVTVFVKTVGCGYVSNYSYFKIIDGGAGGAYYRLGNHDATAVSDETGLTIYPSPASRELNLQWNSTKANDEEVMILVTDINGKVLQRQETTSNAHSTNNYQLDISALPPAMYYYKVLIGGSPYFGKFTKL